MAPENATGLGLEVLLRSGLTAVLVGITAYYARQTRATVVESRRDRKRPWIRRLATFGVNAHYNTLVEHGRKLGAGPHAEGRRPLPKLRWVEMPDDVTLSDLDREYDDVDVSDALDRYGEALAEYRSVRADLHADLADYVSETQLADVLPAESQFRDVSLYGHSAGFVADAVLFNPEVGSVSERSDRQRLLRAHRDELVSLREHERFADRVERLEATRDSLAGLQPSLERDLGRARDRLYRDYGLTATEINNVLAEERADEDSEFGIGFETDQGAASDSLTFPLELIEADGGTRFSFEGGS